MLKLLPPAFNRNGATVLKPVIAPIGGGIVAVNIAGGPEGERGECGGGTAQQAIVVTIQQPTNASFTVVEHDFDPVIYLRSECDDPQSMIQCNDDSNGQASRIPENGGTILLQPGTYFLIVDAFFRLGAGDGAATVLSNSPGQLAPLRP